MGKSLIINGADFSQNGIELFDTLIGYSEENYSLCSLVTNPGTGTPYIFCDKLNVFSSVPIKGIRIKPKVSGVIPVYVANFSADTGENIMSDSVFKENLVVTGDMLERIVNIYFENPITLQNGQKLVFGNKDAFTMTARWSFGEDQSIYPDVCISTNSGQSFAESVGYSLYLDYII